MKQNVSFNTFYNAFQETRPNNFSYNGLRALYDYLSEYENSIGEEIEFDMIALCCDFSEYENFEEFKNDYQDFETLKELQEHTTVIMIDDESFIIQVF